MLIAATGPRKLILSGTDTCQAALAQVKAVLSSHRDVEVLSGMAEGFDECVAFAAIELGLPLHAVVPNEGYGGYYWGRNSMTKTDRMEVFEGLLAYAGENGSIEYVIEDVYNTSGVEAEGKHSNWLRNERLVERADRFVALNWNTRGTNHCIRMVKEAGLQIDFVEV